MRQIKEIYAYRTMLGSLVRKELVTRYKGSVLGFLWTFINPLLQLLVYSLVFSVVMRIDIENYSLFLFVALIPWFFLSSTIVGGASCIVNESNLIKKIYFPRMIIPISKVTSGFFNMLFSMIIVLAALLMGGIGLSGYLLVLPVVMIIEYLFILGIVVILSSLTVYFRDLQHIFEIVVMAWFYLTPIVYTLEMVPDEMRWIMVANPMTSIIAAYRDILFNKAMPDFATMGTAALFGILSTVIGMALFDRLQRGFAEEL